MRREDFIGRHLPPRESTGVVVRDVFQIRLVLWTNGSQNTRRRQGRRVACAQASHGDFLVHVQGSDMASRGQDHRSRGKCWRLQPEFDIGGVSSSSISCISFFFHLHFSFVFSTHSRSGSCSEVKCVACPRSSSPRPATSDLPLFSLYRVGTSVFLKLALLAVVGNTSLFLDCS
jgi:hypothetical protein